MCPRIRSLGILFDLTALAHHRIYQPLVVKYPDLNMRALTDDCVPMEPRPADDDYGPVYELPPTLSC